MPVSQSPIGAVGSGQTAILATATGAASIATATIAAGNTTNQTAWVSGFVITGLGATGATTVVATLTGLLGAVGFNFDISVPAGVTTAISPLIVNFVQPIPASNASTAIVLSVPSFGAGNTAVHINMWGFYQ